MEGLENYQFCEESEGAGHASRPRTFEEESSSGKEADIHTVELERDFAKYEKLKLLLEYIERIKLYKETGVLLTLFWRAPKIKINIKCKNAAGYLINYPLTENVKNR